MRSTHIPELSSCHLLSANTRAADRGGFFGEEKFITNPFSRRASSLSGPGIDYQPVTPDDATDLTDIAASIYVEGGGTIQFISIKGQTRTVTLPDFGWLVCGVTRVMATGTTASGIHAVVVS